MSIKLSIKHLFIILPLVALAGFIGYKVFQAVKAKSEIQPAATGQPGGGRGGPGGGRAQTVQTGAVSSGKISEKITLTGSLKAKERVDVNPKIQGRIVSITVDTGQAGARGALIAEIEERGLREEAPAREVEGEGVPEPLRPIGPEPIGAD